MERPEKASLATIRATEITVWATEITVWATVISVAQVVKAKWRPEESVFEGESTVESRDFNLSRTVALRICSISVKNLLRRTGDISNR